MSFFRRLKAQWLFLLIVGALLLAAGTVIARPYAVGTTWFTADAGGGTSQGGNYTLSATVGQIDAGTLEGGRYTMDSGFWPGPLHGGNQINDTQVYIPLVRR